MMTKEKILLGKTDWLRTHIVAWLSALLSLPDCIIYSFCYVSLCLSVSLAWNGNGMVHL